MPKAEYAVFKALDPFFRIVEQGLSGFVDGDHYFDTVADDALFEFRYNFPVFPQTVSGRANLMTLYSGYGKNIMLHGGDALVRASVKRWSRRDTRIRSTRKDSCNG